MRKRWIGCAVWLLLAACLYFFENNTGTRTVLAASLLVPLVPLLRRVFFAADAPAAEAERPLPLTIRTFARQETDEPGDVREYRPGDPIRRIHWKLSAKKDALLVRETAAEPEVVEEEQLSSAPADGQKVRHAGRAAGLLLGLMLLCAALLLLIPEARHGFQALCNRIFAASEARNAYAYTFFTVAENQRVWLAAALLTILFAALTALVLLLRSRVFLLGIMAGCTLFQAYFGLPFPAWVNIPLYGLLALGMLRRPVSRKSLLSVLGTALGTALLIVLLFPGVDAATESASETVRDQLSRMAQQAAGVVSELPEGETETRHVHTQSLQTGANEARTGREYRLVTVEEEQISQPHWIDWLKVSLLLLLTVALLSLPFAPFLLLNARKKKALEARKAFASEDVGEAVRAIFRHVVLWLSETGHDAGNLLYRDWPDVLPEELTEAYARRFARCAMDYEEAAYSEHALPEETRQRALELLQETETALWKAADWRQRLRIRYWMCLCE
ncbi:MAG: DUF58 domain-containing protein [Clostridia bacterium]|nr:DUF58 domain-containing protein [Clostridia bacterium]